MKALLSSVFALPAIAACCGMFSIRSLSAESSREAGERVSGPFVHGNLAIFLIHGESRAANGLLTLEQAVAGHKVVVYETRNVNALAIENVSDEEVFIESGDIVKGGAQDRTLKDDFILPAKSGRVNIDAFCVEHGRWTRRGSEPVGTFDSARDAIATKKLKIAVRVNSDQHEVWNQVAAAQASISSALRSDARAAAAPTSLAMTIESPAVRLSIEGYIQDLKGIVGGHSDVIGYAFAINGEVNSADVYRSHDLFARLWQKRLRATAVEAVSELESGGKFAPATIAAVSAALRDAESGKASERAITGRLSVLVRETPGAILFETRDQAHAGAWIHRSYLIK